MRRRVSSRLRYLRLRSRRRRWYEDGEGRVSAGKAGGGDISAIPKLLVERKKIFGQGKGRWYFAFSGGSLKYHL